MTTKEIQIFPKKIHGIYMKTKVETTESNQVLILAMTSNLADCSHEELCKSSRN